MILLNLGCGIKTSDDPNVVNIDWSFLLRMWKNPVLKMVAPLFLDSTRLDRLKCLPGNIVIHDLASGIPFPDDSVDAVYHSHLLEHLDRSVALEFMKEVKRVLKPGGIHRICVPDFETLCRNYLSHLEAVVNSTRMSSTHDSVVAAIIEQSVRKEAHGTSLQSPVRRWIENVLFGDARRRGETHQWMYDRCNLAHFLAIAGYENIEARQCGVSGIPDWSRIGLEVDSLGREYKPESLYMEAMKPPAQTDSHSEAS